MVQGEETGEMKPRLKGLMEIRQGWNQDNRAHGAEEF